MLARRKTLFPPHFPCPACSPLSHTHTYFLTASLNHPTRQALARVHKQSAIKGEQPIDRESPRAGCMTGEKSFLLFSADQWPGLLGTRQHEESAAGILIMGEGTWTDVDAMGKDPDLMSTMG